MCFDCVNEHGKPTARPLNCFFLSLEMMHTVQTTCASITKPSWQWPIKPLWARSCYFCLVFPFLKGHRVYFLQNRNGDYLRSGATETSKSPAAVLTIQSESLFNASGDAMAVTTGIHHPTRCELRRCLFRIPPLLTEWLLSAMLHLYWGVKCATFARLMNVSSERHTASF